MNQAYYDCLGLSNTATPEEIKAAYHAKLKEFPAHTHPQDFKAVRTAYEALRKAADLPASDFLKPRPIEVKIDTAPLASLKVSAKADIQLSLKELIELTF